MCFLQEKSAPLLCTVQHRIVMHRLHVWTRSWHGSRSSSQRSLAFFVDLSSSAAAADAQQLQQRRVASARARTRAASCSTAFFVELGGSVRSTSRQETSDQLQEMSSDISIKSKEIFAKNIQQSQSFFTKLKAFIDFLNMPNYSKEEVRHKKVLADKITRYSVINGYYAYMLHN